MGVLNPAHERGQGCRAVGMARRPVLYGCLVLDGCDSREMAEMSRQGHSYGGLAQGTWNPKTNTYVDMNEMGHGAVTLLQAHISLKLCITTSGYLVCSISMLNPGSARVKACNIFERG